MVIRLVKHVFVPLIVVFIVISSLLLNKTVYLLPMAVSGIMFSLSLIWARKVPLLRYFSVVFLGSFHWFSQLNWCQILYIVLTVLAIERNQRISSSLIFSTFFWLQYTVIRLFYIPITPYSILVSVYDLITFLFVIAFFRYIIISEKERKKLRKQTEFLALHDSLTGLLNYNGYVKKMNGLAAKEISFALITVDVLELKSYNTPDAASGNEVLANMSLLLQALFPNSLLLSRYAGDRFAIAIPQKEDSLAHIDRILDIDKLGFQATYSVTLFPQDAAAVSELMTLAEDKLFHTKRAAWLKREELRFQEEKLRVVGELAAGMAHEIRNPLTTIKGFMQLSRTNDYIMKPWFDLIMGEIARMTELTSEFLQFSKPHISNMKVEPIKDCIDRVLSLTESEAALRGHLLSFEGADERLYVNLDRDKMVQVLLNLVRNAFEAMTQPDVVQIRLSREGDKCRVQVEDNGCGIPDHELAKVLSPFYTTKENGTGLGLPICQKIVQDHGGTLEVNSVSGRGTVITMRLPCAEKSA